MIAKKSFIEIFGDVMSTILLGNTKELIIRMDERLRNVEKNIETLSNNFKKLENKTFSLKGDFATTKMHVDILWTNYSTNEISSANSPRKLNALGKKILKESNMGIIIENKKEHLLQEVRTRNPTNPYDAEQAIFETIEKIPELFPEIVIDLKNGAFKAGENMGMVLIVGGFYLRDLIFEDLGFSLDI